MNLNTIRRLVEQGYSDEEIADILAPADGLPNDSEFDHTSAGFQYDALGCEYIDEGIV